MTNSDEPLNALTASQAAKLIAEGEITSEALVRACLDRIEAREGSVKAWAYLDPDLALEQARARDRTPPAGPLHGVPVGVKDVIDTVDQPTQMGSPIYEGHQPTADASCVALARRAGAVILGKTVTCEFAGMQPNVTSNPHNPAYTPGGSSSGSAAAVADHMVPLAYGTQTGGSIIRPASFCGVVGYKPTYGRINRAGLKFAAESLDTIGFMGRSVDDVQLMLEAHVGKFAPFELGNNLKFGVCRTYLWDEKATDETDRALKKAVDVLKDVAVEIVDFDLSTTFWDVTDHRNVIDNVERAYGMAHEWNAHKDQLSEVLAGRIELGLGTNLDDYEEAKIWLEQIRPALAPAMKGLDALITPAVLGEAPEGLGFTGDTSFQSLWTALHVPAITLPFTTGDAGLPIGIQLIAPRWQDDELLAIARRAEAALRQAA